MSKTEIIPQTNTHFVARFTISFEIILIYIATGLIVLTFFDSIKVFFYASLGYIAFFMFLSLFITMTAYTIYNFSKYCYLVVKR